MKPAFLLLFIIGKQNDPLFRKRAARFGGICRVLPLFFQFRWTVPPPQPNDVIRFHLPVNFHAVCRDISESQKKRFSWTVGETNPVLPNYFRCISNATATLNFVTDCHLFPRRTVTSAFAGHAVCSPVLCSSMRTPLSTFLAAC